MVIVNTDENVTIEYQGEIEKYQSFVVIILFKNSLYFDYFSQWFEFVVNHIQPLEMYSCDFELVIGVDSCPIRFYLFPCYTSEFRFDLIISDIT